MVADAGQNIPEIGLGIKAIEPGGPDQGVDDGGALAALVGTGEEPVLAADGERPDRALGGVVVDLQIAAVGIAGERGPARQAVADRPGEFTLARQLGQGRVEPGPQIGEPWNGVLLPRSSPFVGRAATDGVLDLVELPDPIASVNVV